MKRFDTVILGSGYFSVGYALSSESTLIIERTQLADPSFGGTLSGFGFKSSSEWTPETKQLHSFYLEKKIVKGASLNSSVSEVGLCAYIRNRNVSILLGTECIDAVKENGGYALTVINNGGYDRIFCQRLIDTRCLDKRNELNILCRGDSKILDGATSDLFKSTVTGAFEADEFIVSLTFNDEENINSCKAHAIRYLESVFAEGGAQVVQWAYAMRPVSGLPAFEKGEILRVRELSFFDAFAAFDGGVRYASEVTV